MSSYNMYLKRYTYVSRALLSSMLSLLLICPLFGVMAKQSARELAYQQMELGEKAFKGKKFAQGIEHFERAYRHFPSNDLLHKIAQAHDKISNNCKARLKAWEKLTAKCNQCELKKKVQQGYRNTTKQCEVEVHIQAKNSKVSVLIDDELYGQTPLTVLLAAARYRIELIDGEQKTLYTGKLKVKKSRKSKKAHYLWTGSTFQNKARSYKKTAKKSGKKKTKTNKHKKPKNHVAVANHPDQPHTVQLHPMTTQKIQLQATLECQYLDHKQKYQPYPDCDGAQLKARDRFRVIFNVSQPSYVYLFLSNGHGDRSMLFPDVGVNNQVKKRVEYIIPGQGWYELDDQGNTTERVHLIASAERVNQLESARGAHLNLQALKKLKMMSFRGVRKRTRPAILGKKLKNIDSIIEAQGTQDTASLLFSIQHK